MPTPHLGRPSPQAAPATRCHRRLAPGLARAQRPQVRQARLPLRQCGAPRPRAVLAADLIGGRQDAQPLHPRLPSGGHLGPDRGVPAPPSARRGTDRRQRRPVPVPAPEGEQRRKKRLRTGLRASDRSRDRPARSPRRGGRDRLRGPRDSPPTLGAAADGSRRRAAPQH